MGFLPFLHLRQLTAPSPLSFCFSKKVRALFFLSSLPWLSDPRPATYLASQQPTGSSTYDSHSEQAEELAFQILLFRQYPNFRSMLILILIDPCCASRSALLAYHNHIKPILTSKAVEGCGRLWKKSNSWKRQKVFLALTTQLYNAYRAKTQIHRGGQWRDLEAGWDSDSKLRANQASVFDSPSFDKSRFAAASNASYSSKEPIIQVWAGFVTEL